MTFMILMLEVNVYITSTSSKVLCLIRQWGCTYKHSNAQLSDNHKYLVLRLEMYVPEIDSFSFFYSEVI